MKPTEERIEAVIDHASSLSEDDITRVGGRRWSRQSDNGSGRHDWDNTQIFGSKP